MTVQKAVKQVTESMKAPVDFSVTNANDPRNDPPTPSVMPAPLKRACGIDQPWKK